MCWFVRKAPNQHIKKAWAFVFFFKSKEKEKRRCKKNEDEERSAFCVQSLKGTPYVIMMGICVYRLCKNLCKYALLTSAFWHEWEFFIFFLFRIYILLPKNNYTICFIYVRLKNRQLFSFALFFFFCYCFHDFQTVEKIVQKKKHKDSRTN